MFLLVIVYLVLNVVVDLVVAPSSGDVVVVVVAVEFNDATIVVDTNDDDVTVAIVVVDVIVVVVHATVVFVGDGNVVLLMLLLLMLLLMMLIDAAHVVDASYDFVSYAPSPSYSQFLRAWREMDGRQEMLPWVVGDEDDNEIEFYQYTRAKHGNEFKLIAAHKEKGMCSRVCECTIL